MAALRGCSSGSRRRAPTLSASRRSRLPTRNVRRACSRTRATARFGTASARITASPSSREASGQPSFAAAAGRRAGPAGALPRGAGEGPRRRIGVSAERQPAARTEVRLQAGLVRALQRARPCLAGLGKAGGAGGRSQRGPRTFTTNGSGGWTPWCSAFRRLVEQGWIDATRHLHPDERIYTFWVNDAAFRRNAGFRMDFLMLTPSLLPRLRATGVDRAHRGREKPSDHAPVWVQL